MFNSLLVGVLGGLLGMIYLILKRINEELGEKGGLQQEMVIN